MKIFVYELYLVLIFDKILKYKLCHMAIDETMW